MTRWSLSNILRKIQFTQFQSLSSEFQNACEKSFGTESSIALKLMSQPKAFTTFMDDVEQARLNEINNNNTISSFDSIDSVTEEHWNNAAYVEITIRPTDKEKAPSSAFGHLEFKGNCPKSATYYLQGGEHTDGAKPFVTNNHKSMVVGDGYDSHGDQSGLAYMRIASKLGSSSKIVAAVLEKGKFTLKL